MAFAPLLQAEKLQKHYAQQVAVEQVSLTLRQGEVLGLLGLNGAGKSTTLSMLAGVTAPSQGWVRVADLDINQYPNETRGNLGYLPDTPPLYPELRVREYLRYGAQLRRVKRQHLDSAVARAIEICALGEAADRLLRNLSKGYRQRVGIAQALIHEPKLLILDEPSSGLDPLQLLEMRRLIRELAKHSGIIVSSHLLPDITATCDRVAIIHQGRLIHEESLQQTPDTTQIRYFLRLQHAVPADEMQAIPGLLSAADTGDNTWALLIQGGRQSAVLEALVRNSWRVLEYSQATHDLEQRFADLTTGKLAPEARS